MTLTRPLTILGQAEPRKERADALKNRARILEAARKVMKKKTLDELCMDELAALAGVGKGTLYRRFEDKQALLHALLDDDELALQEHVKATFGTAKANADPRAAAVALLDTLYGFVVDHAEVLAAAAASARGAARFNCAPYAWRHAVIAAQLRRAQVAEDDQGCEQIADMLLATMSGEIVLRALSVASAQGIKARAHAFFVMVTQRPVPAPTPPRSQQIS